MKSRLENPYLYCFRPLKLYNGRFHSFTEQQKNISVFGKTKQTSPNEKSNKTTFFGDGSVFVRSEFKGSGIDAELIFGGSSENGSIYLAKKTQMTDAQTFEWLYWDVHQPDGYDLVFSLHVKPFMSHFAVSIFDVFVYQNNRLLLHKFLLFSPDKLQIEQNGNRIHHRDNPLFLLERNTRTLTLSARADWLTLDLEMTTDTPLSAPLDVHFPARSSALQTFRWLLFMPLAKASGTMQIQNKKGDWQKITLNGRAYHDANSGGFNLKKELKAWQWMKIYQNETLWIAGKIVPLHEQVNNVLLRVRMPRVDLTLQANIESDEHGLNIVSPLGDLHFDYIEHYKLDDLRFLVPVWPKPFESLEKIREILAAFTLDRKILAPLRNWLTNGKYRRRRWLARDAQNRNVEIFGEEMFLND